MAEPLADVIINIHKGRNGYGIYFALKDGTVTVTRLDEGSEAQKAGVQVGDMLVFVQDNDNKVPDAQPGTPVYVTSENYSEVLNYVRVMKHCRLAFLSQGMQQFM
jgi:hypothetical protein